WPDALSRLRRFMRGVKLSATFGALLTLAAQAWAGWEIEQSNYNLRSNGKEIDRTSAVMRVSKNRARIADGETVTVFDYDSGRVTLLLPEKKQYWDGSIDQYQDEVRDASPRRRVPPEIQGTPPRKPEVHVTETGVTETIAGKQTKKYSIISDG